MNGPLPTMRSALFVPLAVCAWLVPRLVAAPPLHAPRPADAVHDQVCAVAFDEARRLISVGSEGSLKLWNPRTGRPLRTWRLIPVDGRVVVAQFSAGTDRLAIARLDGLYDVWDVRRMTLARRLTLPDAETYGFAHMALSADGGTLVVMPNMGRLRAWSLPKGHIIAELPTDAIQWDRIALSPDGSCLARSGRAPAELRDSRSGRLLRTFSPESRGSIALGWAPGGDAIALSASPRDRRPDALLVEPTGPGSSLRLGEAPPSPASAALAFSPDGGSVASVVTAAVRTSTAGLQPTGAPQVWDRTTRWRRFDRLTPLPAPGHSQPATCLAWSPDARTLATGARDGRVIVWNARTGVRVAVARER